MSRASPSRRFAVLVSRDRWEFHLQPLTDRWQEPGWYSSRQAAEAAAAEARRTWPAEQFDVVEFHRGEETH